MALDKTADVSLGLIDEIGYARRLGLWGQNEYYTLRPVADLKRELTEAVTDFIANPREWEPSLAAEEDQARAAESVRLCQPTCPCCTSPAFLGQRGASTQTAGRATVVANS